MKLLDIIIAAEGRVGGSSAYGWNCWGDNARLMEVADADGMEFCSIVFDNKTYNIYDIDMSVPGTDQCFKWINPEFKDAYLQESKMRNIDPLVAWDDVYYTELSDSETVMNYFKDIAATYYDDLPILENQLE